MRWVDIGLLSLVLIAIGVEGFTSKPGGVGKVTRFYRTYRWSLCLSGVVLGSWLMWKGDTIGACMGFGMFGSACIPAIKWAHAQSIKSEASHSPSQHR